jgi:hypothetical protein
VPLFWRLGLCWVYFPGELTRTTSRTYTPLSSPKGSGSQQWTRLHKGYFRQELYLPEPIQQAWVTVAATDSFILYLNGKAVDGKGYASLNVSGIYDIGQYLSSGKNVVGVVVRRLSYPGPAMVVLEGAYRDQSGREHVFATDPTWKCSRLEQAQGRGEIPWHSESFDATEWRTAGTAGRLSPSDVYLLGAHPWVFAMPPQGKWIQQADAVPGQATFSYTMTLVSRVEDAWIRVAASKPYALAINGITVEGGEEARDVEVMRLLRFHGTSVWQSKEGGSTDLYRIAPLLRAGANRITISAGQRGLTMPGIYVDGFIVAQGEVRPFGSDATWTVTTGIPTTTQSVAQDNAIILGRDAAGYEMLPVKQVMTAVLPLSYVNKQLVCLGAVVFLTAGAIYLLWVGSARVLHGLQAGDPEEVKRLVALTHLPIGVGLGGLYLLSFDVRFDPALPFQSVVIWLSVAALLLFEGLLLLEAWYRNKRPGEKLLPTSDGPTAAKNLYAASAVLCLMIIGALFRLHNLDAQSLYHDEIHMVTYVQGLLEKGYPHKMIGPIERPLATYELAPYPIALSALLFGLNDFAFRLPAAVFGIMTIPLIYLVGSRVFHQQVGLLAAAIYTLCPQALIWAQYLWHPQ